MGAFLQKQNQTRQRVSFSITGSRTAALGASHQAHPILHLQRTIGNQAVQRLLQHQAKPDDLEAHDDTPAAKVAGGSEADAFTFGGHIAFARARLPDTADGKRLVAHELTHAIQQARLPRLRAEESRPAVDHGAHGLAHPDRSIRIGTVSSPHIALSPEKKGRGAPAPASSTFDGVLLGTNKQKKEVRVKREVGGTHGYDDRLQAIAVARLAKADPSAVVLGKDQKWHAVETTAEFGVGRVSANDPKASETTAGGNVPFVEVHGLPSLTGIDQSRQTVDALKAKLAELNARKPTSAADRKAVQEERDQVLRDLTQANQSRAKFILGVPESEIQFNKSSIGRTAGKINITGLPDVDSPGGGHGPVAGQGGVDFTSSMVTAFDIDHPKLDDPARAQTIMFHETSHLKDYAFAQQWVKNYETEANRIFVSGEPGRKPFKAWLDVQVTKKRLTKADVELIIDETADRTATTEARANVHTFLAALQAGAADVATKELVGYANALKPGAQYASPAAKSEVVAALVTELKTSYRQMPKEMKRQYDAAVAAAKKANPGAWISDLDFSK